jgi:hypothetical protein
LGTIPTDEICKVSIGKVLNGPTILPKSISFCTLAELGVIDIKSAFRLLRVHPDDFELLGIKIDGEYYIDKCLPMGCSIS